MPAGGILDRMTAPVRVSLETFLGMEETKPYLELIDGGVVPKAMPGPKHSAAVVELITELETPSGGTPSRALTRNCVTWTAARLLSTCPMSR